MSIGRIYLTRANNKILMTFDKNQLVPLFINVEGVDYVCLDSSLSVYPTQVPEHWKTFPHTIITVNYFYIKLMTYLNQPIMDKRGRKPVELDDAAQAQKEIERENIQSILDAEREFDEQNEQ